MHWKRLSAKAWLFRSRTTRAKLPCRSIARAVASMPAWVLKDRLCGSCTIGVPGKRSRIAMRIAWWRGQISPELPPPYSRMMEESAMKRSHAGE